MTDMNDLRAAERQIRETLESVVQETLKPGDPRFGKIDMVRQQIDKVLIDSDLDVASCLAALSASMADAALQMAPEMPCLCIPALSSLIHESIHSRGGVSH